MILLSQESLNIVDKKIESNFDKILEYISLHSYNLKKMYELYDSYDINDIKDLLNSPLISLKLDLDNKDNKHKITSFLTILKDNNYKGIIVSNINGSGNSNGNGIHITQFLDTFLFDFNETPILKLDENINILDTIQNLNYFIKNKNNKVNLYFSYYTDKNNERQQEIEKCLEINLSNPLFNKVIIIDESENKEFNKTIKTIIDKYHIKIPIFIINTKNRYKFCDFFNIANKYFTKDSDINILINSDIIIGKGLNDINLTENQMICLSRHNINKDHTISVDVGGGSHDCWIWKGKIRGGDDKSIGNFYTGKFLCDGVLANQLYDKRYSLKNPINGLFIYHYHISEVRHYLNFKEGDYVDGLRMGIKFSENNNNFCIDDLYYDGCGFVCN